MKKFVDGLDVANITFCSLLALNDYKELEINAPFRKLQKLELNTCNCRLQRL